MASAGMDGRIHVGIVGCGTIAQIVHLPYLKELSDRFTIAALCDVAPGTLEAVGEQWGVPAHARFADYRALCTSDLVDAVMVCPSGSHVPPAVAALEAGKHVIVEKPLCSRLDEADQLVEVARAAKQRSGAVALMAYMKRFDPGYQYGERLVRPMAERGEIRYVDARHIHAHNDLYSAHHHILRGTGGVPDSVREASRAASEQAIAHSMGRGAPPALRRAFGGLMGSTIHDLYVLNGLLGRPKGVLASEAWDEGNCRTAILAYPGGVRVSYAHIDIRDVRAFKEDVVCYGADTQVTIAFPQPYLTSAPTTVTVQGMESPPDDPAPYGRAGKGEPGWQDAGPAQWQKLVTASYQNAYKREWIHFHACITQGVEPAATVEEARDDTAFIVEWARQTRVA